MTAAIIEALAKEFSVEAVHVQRVLELLEAGWRVPTIARVRRHEIGRLTEGTIRRLQRRLREFEDLEKRRATLLASIEEQRKGQKEAEAEDEDLTALRNCLDRFELEDLFLPHRRPEPEVLLALDRGLGPLADELVTPVPGAKKTALAKKETDSKEGETSVAAESVSPDAAVTTQEVTVSGDVSATGAATSESTEGAETAAQEENAASEPAAAEASPGDPAASGEEGGASPSAGDEGVSGPLIEGAVHGLHVDLSPELARVCAPYVNTDRGIHTDEQALEGAVRILSDRLGRSPGLRGKLRRLMRKHGRISVRALVPEKTLGRNRSLLKLEQHIRQLQGHRLLALRQAQMQRQVSVHITLDEKVVLPKVRAALGTNIRPEFESVAEAIAQQALLQRLLPMIEDEVRGELRDRADDEALRFLAQHLRQILLTPPAGPRTCAGVHIDPKGDWWIAVVDRSGMPQVSELKIEAGSASPSELAALLQQALEGTGVRDLACGHAKTLRDSVLKLRSTIELLKADATVFLANEAGLSSWANSEAARRELPDASVPARQAIGLARRHQDPLNEFLKTDPRHLGLGREQSVVTKAQLRRLIADTLESCAAHVGCDLNAAPLEFLRHVPGLNFELAKKLVERRAERPFSSREELRTEGLLDDTTWTNAIAYLRIDGSPEPLDRTAIHPEQYDLVRRMILGTGQSVEEALGRRDATKGMHREEYEIDEYTWRDLTREITHPGRDPRPRVFPPRLLPTDSDPKELAKDQVVEGIVSSLTSFGAFVDLGIPRDGMIHISEVSGRYVRDARVLLSIGQIVRARVLDGSGPRVELSLKNVPDVRRGGPRHGGAKGGGRGRKRPRDGERSEGNWPEYQPVMRAARSRRDGLVGGKPERERRGGRGGGGKGGGGGGGGGRPGGGRPGGGRPGGGRPGGGRRDRRDRDEHYDPAAVREVSKSSSTYNPFATFFKEKKDEGVQED